MATELYLAKPESTLYLQAWHHQQVPVLVCVHRKLWISELKGQPMGSADQSFETDTI